MFVGVMIGAMASRVNLLDWIIARACTALLVSHGWEVSAEPFILLSGRHATGKDATLLTGLVGDDDWIRKLAWIDIIGLSA